jgi:ribulose-phosphate 3-epimerase
MFRLAPSILSADFGRLADHVGEAVAAGADWLHIDVMDGRFVPNITIGPLVVASLRREFDVPLDVHLMIVEPDRYLEAFAEAGADYLTVHVETCPHLHRTVQAIKELGLKAGVTLNPATPLSSLKPILPDVDLLLVMSVNPGFGGQRYIPASTERIRRLRQWRDAHNPDALISVDGGVKPDNAATIAGAGADVLVAGSAIFGGPGSVADNIAALRRALKI